MDIENNSLWNVAFWIVVYLLFCGIVPEILEIILNNKLNILILIIFNLIFLSIFLTYNSFIVRFIFVKVNFTSIILTLSLPILFYILLDKNLDPFLDSLFPASAREYGLIIEGIKSNPLEFFIRICIIAPIIEEFIIRGYILELILEKDNNKLKAILISNTIFAILHFNFVQTISSFIIGILIGILYIKTRSLTCCIATHFLYNFISFIVILS